MSKTTEFEYVEVKEFLHLPVIEVAEVKSFIRFAGVNGLKFIFKVPVQEGRSDFFFPLQGIVYKINGVEVTAAQFYDVFSYEEKPRLDEHIRDWLRWHLTFNGKDGLERFGLSGAVR